MNDLSASGIWMMFALWMFSGNHYICGILALVFSFISSLER